MLAVALVALVAWLGLAVHPARPWDLGPRDPAAPDPTRWPDVTALVPARNEAAMLPQTLPALAAQDYPGRFRVVLVDDRSEDGTAEIARSLESDRFVVVDGAALPSGWVGKVWALAQAAEQAGEAELLLLTDADILHGPASLRLLVADLLHRDLALTSRMAILRAETAPERLLIPAFVFFFACLYPMRRVGRGGRQAAAAGGCILLRREALERAGGLAVIRGEIIDDVNLARAVSRHGGVRLASSTGEQRSLRPYGSVGAVWRMVRRTAFDQLGYSWLLLALTVVGLVVLFVVPVAALVLGLALVSWPLALVGAAAWAVQALLVLPAVRHLGVGARWAAALPVAGLIYGCMTVDSALRHARGAGSTW
ncbi:MAG: glycosyltransferase [Actinobacteria bacterium]|nr:glycosyltransferase [Actinomycetota bacterium]